MIFSLILWSLLSITVVSGMNIPLHDPIDVSSAS